MQSRMNACFSALIKFLISMIDLVDHFISAITVIYLKRHREIFEISFHIQQKWQQIKINYINNNMFDERIKMNGWTESINISNQEREKATQMNKVIRIGRISLVLAWMKEWKNERKLFIETAKMFSICKTFPIFQFSECKEYTFHSNRDRSSLVASSQNGSNFMSTYKSIKAN